MKNAKAALAALGLGSTAHAAISQQCPSSDVCYSLSIPDTTASSGNGDIYFQLSAPTTYSYVALGQGSAMAGSNIFVMYTSSDGNNVTISPRLGPGKGYAQPEHDTSAKITVLEGSGVKNGVMTGNVKCSNCQSWNGGSMDFTDSSASWIYAMKSGSSLDSDSLSENIDQHDAAAPFTWDISSAKGGNDVNPFTSNAASTGSTGSKSSPGSSGIPPTCTSVTGSLASPSGSGCPTAWPTEFSSSWPTARPTWAASCFPSGHHGPPGRGHGPWPSKAPWSDTNKKQKRADGCPAGYESTSNAISGAETEYVLSTKQKNTLLAHGALACIAWVALFPMGGILIRLANFSGLIWVHAAFQIFAYIVYIAAFALGVGMAVNAHMMTKAHPIIGIALFFIFLGQPIFGWLHHKLFKKYQHRTFWSYAHLWHGRVAILLGMVNGGLGLQLASAGKTAKIAYAVIAAIVGVVYLTAIFIGERRRRRAPPNYEKSQRDYSLRDLSSSEQPTMQQREHYGGPGRTPSSGRREIGKPRMHSYATRL